MERRLLDPNPLLNNSSNESSVRAGRAPPTTPPTLTLALALGPGITLLFTLKHKRERAVSRLLLPSGLRKLGGRKELTGFQSGDRGPTGSPSAGS